MKLLWASNQHPEKGLCVQMKPNQQPFTCQAWTKSEPIHKNLQYVIFQFFNFPHLLYCNLI